MLILLKIKRNLVELIHIISPYLIQKASNVFDVSIYYFVSDTDEDLKEVRIVDKGLMEMVKLIDSMFNKKKILNLVTKENIAVIGA